MKHILTLLVVISTSFLSIAQSETEDWQVYMASYEGKPGSTSLRMDLIQKAPISSIPFVVVTGVTFSTENSDGLPTAETFPLLYEIDDALVALFTEKSTSILAGTFTYNKERLSYFYIADTNGIRAELERLYQNKYPQYKYYINCKADRDWKYYTDFLYPNEATRNHMFNQSVVIKLMQAGDPLTQPRRIDHWLYFSSSEEVRLAEHELEKLGFTILPQDNSKSTEPSRYEIHCWRRDAVDLAVLNPITAEIRNIAKKYNGEYDGWETVVLNE